ncbi:MAG: ABC transporter substrate-binding protein [Cyclobacteriaceae bacterium]
MRYSYPIVYDIDLREIVPGNAELLEYHQNDSLLIYELMINEQAVWNNGDLITCEDFETSVKLLKIPLIDNFNLRVNRQWILSVSCSSENPQYVEITVNGSFLNLKYHLGSFPILPKYLYDPDGLLDEISFDDLLYNEEQIKHNPQLIKYSEFFDSEQLKRNVKLISAGYRITANNPGQYIRYEKEDEWWGFNSGVGHLASKPHALEYIVINDDATALIALKNNAIDVLAGIAPSSFNDLKSNDIDTDNYHFVTPTLYRFGFLTMNSRLKKLSKPTRESVASMVPYDRLIQIGLFGYGNRTVGPINPIDSIYYNFDIELNHQDANSALEKLKEVGYRLVKDELLDQNGNQLTLSISYPAGDTKYETIALILQDALQNNGIKAPLNPVDASLFTKKLKSHEYDLALRHFNGSPFSHNFSGIFSTAAAAIGGLNYSGFGDETSDSVINAINIAKTEDSKISALKEFQRLLHEEKTMLFLYFEQDRIAINKRVTGVLESRFYPGYQLKELYIENANY